MKKFIGNISTNKIGSDCYFEFEAPDDATEEQIEQLGMGAAFEHIDWYYKEVKCDHTS